MKNILITGVAGFIGSNLASFLLKKGNYKIFGIDNLSYGIFSQVPKDVIFYQEDIRDKDISRLFKDIDVVFHLAAKNCISDCQKDPINTVDINIKGSINIFDAAIKNNVKKIIYADSSSVYEGSKEFPSKEDTINPKSFYAISKNSTNNYLSSYVENTSIKATALRYFNVYGINQDYRRSIPPLISAFIIKILKNKRPYIYGDGFKKRDFIHVNDVNIFHEILINNNQRSNFEIYNVGSGQNYSVNEILDEIKTQLNSNIAPIYKNDLPGEALITLSDITKAKKLGWSAETTLSIGIKEMITHISKNIIDKIN